MTEPAATAWVEIPVALPIQKFLETLAPPRPQGLASLFCDNLLQKRWSPVGFWGQDREFIYFCGDFRDFDQETLVARGGWGPRSRPISIYCDFGSEGWLVTSVS